MSETAGDGGPAPLNLLGTHRHSLDDKRRVAIPKVFRKNILEAGEGDSYVICRELGGDDCLALYPEVQFNETLRILELVELPKRGVGGKRRRAYLRQLRMSASVIQPDRHGRITLSEEQCRLVGIDREAVFVGAGDHAEIWDPNKLDGSEDPDFSLLAQDIFE